MRPDPPSNSRAHAFTSLNPRVREGLVLWDRRSVLKASIAGLAGLSLPGLLRARSEAATAGRPTPDKKSVILLWMTGGPSHIDTWDPKPDAPREIRGPFGTIPTALAGVRLERALAEAGRDARSHDDHPLGRCAVLES